MKILYVCGTYCPSHAGAEISMHTLLKYLQKNYGIEVCAVTDLRYTNNKFKSEYDTVSLFGASHENREKVISEIIDKFKPDLVITQLMWSDVALKLGKEKNIPTVLRVCKIPFEMNVRKGSEYDPTALMAVSSAVKDFLMENYDRDSRVISPPVGSERVVVKNHLKKFIPEKSPYITMFNPLGRKGGKVFKEIVKQMPHKQFAIVLGWSCLKESPEKKEFSKKLIVQMCDSLKSEFSGKVPEYIDFSDCKNVQILESTEDVWKIYSKTRILLVPSQWEEAFGRVGVEGCLNGIPTIGSNIAGLKEAIGSGGILIEDYKNPKAWISAIERLGDKDYYNLVSQRELEWIEEHHLIDSLIKEYFGFFNGLLIGRKNK